MRFARPLATLLLGAAGLLTAMPHAIAQTSGGAWTSPAPQGEEGGVPVAYLEEPQQLTGFASHPDGIVAVTFRLERDAEARPDHPCAAAPGVRPQTATGGSTRVDFSFEATFPCNRRYLVRATAAPADRGDLQEAAPLVLDLWVAVAIPPAEVSGVSAGAASDSRAVEVQWVEAPEHEPDFQGYEIRRSIGDGPFQAVAERPAGVSTFVDTELPAGAMNVRYQVVGMRSGPDAGTRVYSRGGNSSEVEVAAEAPAAEEGDSEGGGGTAATGGSTGSGARPGRSNGAVTGGARTTAGTARDGARRTTTTLDSGFQEALPFQRRGEDPQAAAPSGDSAVVARFADEDDSESQRETLLLVAGGATAFAWAMGLRHLVRRAAI